GPDGGDGRRANPPEGAQEAEATGSGGNRGDGQGGRRPEGGSSGPGHHPRAGTRREIGGSAVKPTAYVLAFVGLLLAVSALVLYLTANPYASGNGNVPAVPWGSNVLAITLLAGAGGAAALSWAMLRFGGTGSAET